MAAPNPHQLLLLADHIKLSLLERQRAQSLNLPADKQDKSIKRSLASLKDGIAALERQKFDQEAAGEDITDLADQISRLSAQESELTTDFATHLPSAATAVPNSPALAKDFSAATSKPSSSSNKTVRFAPYRDSSPTPSAKAALFDRPYSDAPPDDAPSIDQTELSNQQIHAHHSRVLAEQDEQLDILGASIGRQRQLGLEMGEELDSQAIMLEDVEAGVDRHAATLQRARTKLDRIGRKAKDNWSWITITILVLVLIILIVGTK